MMAHAISDARLGIGTLGEPVTDGMTRHTARRMNHCAMTHAAAAIQKITSSKMLPGMTPGSSGAGPAEDCARKRDHMMREN